MERPGRWAPGGPNCQSIKHFETALFGIASASVWYMELFWSYCYIRTELYFNEEGFDDAHVHTERVKSHPEVDEFHVGRGMQFQAIVPFLKGDWDL